MNRLPLMIALCLPALTGAAEQLEALDEQFLEYLAGFEGEDEEDWTLFSEADAEPPAAKTPAAKKQEAAAKPAADRR